MADFFCNCFMEDFVFPQITIFLESWTSGGVIRGYSWAKLETNRNNEYWENVNYSSYTKIVILKILRKTENMATIFPHTKFELKQSNRLGFKVSTENR